MAQRLNDLKTRAAMSSKISVFVICVEAIIYLLLYNVLYCIFNEFSPWKQNHSENDTFDSSLVFPLPLTEEIIHNS